MLPAVSQHDMDIKDFKTPLQEAVNAIRAAGAKTQYILLPGAEWSHASSFLGASKAALSTISDPAGGKALLVYDFHQYLDQDGSGTNRECVSALELLYSRLYADMIAVHRSPTGPTSGLPLPQIFERTAARLSSPRLEGCVCSDVCFALQSSTEADFGNASP